MRTLFLAHGHPALQPGGTEMLARGLFRTLRDAHGVQGLLLAAAEPAQRAPLPGTLLQPVGGAAPDDELLVSLTGFDRFHLAQPDSLGLLATLVLGGGGLLYARSQRRLRAEAPLTDDEDAARPGWG